MPCRTGEWALHLLKDLALLMVRAASPLKTGHRPCLGAAIRYADDVSSHFW